MFRSWQTIHLLLFLVSTSVLLGDEPGLKVAQDNPEADKPFVVALQPDFDNSIVTPAIPAGTTYKWTVKADPESVKVPDSVNEPKLKFVITPNGAKFTITLVKTVGPVAKTFGPITVTIGQTAAIGDLNAAATEFGEELLAADLNKLQNDTPKIAAVCREIADAITTGIDNASDLEQLTNLVRKNVRRIITTTTNIPTGKVRQDWADAYDKLIKDHEKAADSFEKRKEAYLLGVAALRKFAESTDPRSSPAAIESDAFDAESIATKIANGLNDPPLELIKFDTEFQKTIMNLVAAIEVLKRDVDPDKVSVTEFKEKTKKAVQEVIGKIEQARDVKERWIKGYNTFVAEADKSERLDTTTSKGWDQALGALIVGLKRAAGIKDSIVAEAKRAQAGRKASSAGGANNVATSSSGYGNTWHGVRTARKVQRIGNRAAVSRARIQRIRGG